MLTDRLSSIRLPSRVQWQYDDHWSSYHHRTLRPLNWSLLHRLRVNWQIYPPFIFFPSLEWNWRPARCVLTIWGGARHIREPFFAAMLSLSDSFRFVKLPCSMVPFMLGLTNWLWSQNYKIYTILQCIKFIQFIQFTWGYSQQKFQSCLHSVRCQMDHAMESHKSGKREIYGSRFLSPSQCMRPHLLPVHRQDLRNTLSRIWEIEFVKSVHFRESEKYTYENLRNRVWKIRWMWLEIYKLEYKS